MERINRVIDWDKVEKRLMDYYEVGRQEEGADAYPPLMLLKAMLLQKWFPLRPASCPENRGGEASGLEGIPSDPELENQIYPVE